MINTEFSRYLDTGRPLDLTYFGTADFDDATEWGVLTAPLAHHPAVACRFASIPPVTKMTIRVLDLRDVEVANPGGVTIWDVLYRMASE